MNPMEEIASEKALLMRPLYENHHRPPPKAESGDATYPP